MKKFIALALASTMTLATSVATAAMTGEKPGQDNRQHIETIDTSAISVSVKGSAPSKADWTKTNNHKR